MKKRIKYIFKIHSWIGLATGLFLFVISVSGSLLVFYEEIDLFLNTELLKVEPKENKVALNEIYFKVKQQYPSATNIRFRHLPKHKDLSIEMNVVKEGTYFLVYANPYTGEIIGERERFTFLMDWLLRLHYSLFAEETGEIIVAIFGLLLFFSIVTGIIVYRKYILKVILFKVPLKFKNWRTASSEIHRVVGVWSLIFNLIIAITGFYMLYPALLPSKDEDKEEKKIEVPINLMVSLDDLLMKSTLHLPGFIPYSINIPNNEEGPIKVVGGVPDVNPLSPAYSSYVSFNQHTASLVEVYDIRDQKVSEQLDKSMYPLHFGNYGGIIVKILYSLFGITPSFLAITGFLLWWRRNGKRKKVNGQPLAFKKGAKFQFEAI